MSRQEVLRNDPCPCGSGKKYKRCCAIEEESEVSASFFRLTIFGVGIALLVGTVVLARTLLTEEPGDGRIWSAAHGHFHGAGGEEPGQAAEAGAGGAGSEGSGEKVWSEEHGHFHGGGRQTEGFAGPGKIWSEEHGHYHDADPIARHTVTGTDQEDRLRVEADRVRRAAEEAE